MEVATGNEPPTRIRPGQSHEIGRGHGLDSSDQTISRRHLFLSVAGATNGEETRLQFEVLGRNPIFVHKDKEVKIFRRFERGEMRDEDMFCVSAKNPVWYTVRRIVDGVDGVRRNGSESESAGKLESDFEFKGVEDLDQRGVDISGLDPVKEFGFVVEGHEFDSYPKKMILDIKNWDWFLENEGKDSEDEGKNVRGSRRRKRKKGAENDDDDEEWSGESEDERVLMDRSRKAPRAKYTTRSKDRGKPNEMSSTRTRNRDDEEEEEDEDEDEDDETLGDFVVDDENLEEEEEGGELEEDEEEEELGDEDDEDDEDE